MIPIPEHLKKFAWYAPHLAWLKSKGVRIQHDLCDAPQKRADLRGANLRGADLRGAVLSGAVLSGADLRGADLRGADVRGAVLCGVVLSGADLRGADIPIIEHIDAQILAAIRDNGNALEMGSWHSCETTHCREIG